MHIIKKLTLLSLALLISSQSFGYYFYYANNVDTKGRRLPSKIAIAVYSSESKFKQFLKDQAVSDKSRGYIIKYGPVFGKITGKLLAPVVNAAVTAETGSKGAGSAAAKVTQLGLEFWGKGMAIVTQKMTKPLRSIQQIIESNHYHERLYMGKDGSKYPNPRCRSLSSIKKDDNITEDKPKPFYVVVFNQDKDAGPDYQVLFNKYLYPMGPNPYEGQYYTGAGKARGGPFASYVIQTSFQETPVYKDGARIKDAQGSLVKDPETGDYVTEKVAVIDPSTGEQKIDVQLVADFTMFHDRGGVDCSAAGKNPGNAPDQGGTLATDTTEETEGSS